MIPDGFVYEINNFHVRFKLFFRFRSNIWHTNDAEILELISMNDFFPVRFGEIFSSQIYGISNSWETISDDWVKFYGT